MKNTTQGFASYIIIVALALLLAAGAAIYFMNNEKTPTDMPNTIATSTTDTASSSDTKTTPTKNSPSGPTVSTGSGSFRSALIGDLTFNYSDAEYKLEDNSPAEFGTGPLILTSKNGGLTVYVARKTQSADNPIAFTEETVKADTSVKGGVPFNKISQNNLTIYEGTAPYKTSEFALTYSIIYNRNLYTFTVTPAKPTSKMSELTLNKAAFAPILNSIQVQR